MTPQTLLAEKLAAYRSTFDVACSALFGGGDAGVTLEYEHEDSDVGATPVAPADSNVPTVDVVPDAATVKQRIREAVRSIAEDFAAEFNAKLADAARQDPSVQMVAPRYEMGPGHVAELEELLGAPLAPLVAKLDDGNLDGARRATIDAWTPLEKRIRAKWQAYFVLTFQDVSVERKAARDRRTLERRFDPVSAVEMAQAEAARRALPDFGAPARQEALRTLSPWIAMAALLGLAAVGGWLLVRADYHRRPASEEPGAHQPATQSASTIGPSR